MNVKRNRWRPASLIVVWLLTAVLIGGCAGAQMGADEPPGGPAPGHSATPAGDGSQLPAGPPGIVGTVTQITPSQASGEDRLGSMLVEENPAEAQGSDKVLVFISESTQILREASGQLRPATFADLVNGQRVRAWFAGPVAESYPAQARGAVVLILE